ncbi:hypothetical protein [Enterococcus faecalis]|uniref:hypothetical protein n=1 Tax=Enterococcus faecalis TaxID=1351 RepID=UPI0039C8909A
MVVDQASFACLLDEVRLALSVVVSVRFVLSGQVAWCADLVVSDWMHLVLKVSVWLQLFV